MPKRTRSRFLESPDLEQLEADLDERWLHIKDDADVIVVRMAQRAGMDMVARIPRDTGRTADSVTWDSAPETKGNEVSAEAGPTHYVARFIEYGFTRRGTTYPPRSFVEPAATAVAVPFIEAMLAAGDLTQKRRTRR